MHNVPIQDSALGGAVGFPDECRVRACAVGALLRDGKIVVIHNLEHDTVAPAAPAAMAWDVGLWVNEFHPAMRVDVEAPAMCCNENGQIACRFAVVHDLVETPAAIHITHAAKLEDGFGVEATAVLPLERVPRAQIVDKVWEWIALMHEEAEKAAAAAEGAGDGSGQ